MAGRQKHTILAGMALAVGLLFMLSLPAPSLAEGPENAGGLLAKRMRQWPQWRLPAPLQSPGRQDLVYQDWFLGDWLVKSSDGTSYCVRFIPSSAGVVGDRSFNAAAVGKALLGKQLEEVANDPANPNRQIARLRRADGERLALESTVVGRRRELPANDELLVDELALQVLHGAGDPRVSRVETLSRFHRQQDGSITAEQWQASYGSPAAGLSVPAVRSDHVSLSLEHLGPAAGPASGTGAPAGGCRQYP